MPVNRAFLTLFDVKKILIVFLLFTISLNSEAIENSADLFFYDEDKVQKEFADLNELESYLIQNPQSEIEEILTAFPSLKNTMNSELMMPLNDFEMAAPGKIPSFWFSFALSAIGTYFIYGAVAGPISVGIVYFSTDKDKTETKKAIWGCVTGTLIGAGIKYAMVNL
jgi:hypothetical protein